MGCCVRVAVNKPPERGIPAGPAAPAGTPPSVPHNGKRPEGSCRCPVRTPDHRDGSVTPAGRSWEWCSGVERAAAAGGAEQWARASPTSSPGGRRSGERRRLHHRRPRPPSRCRRLPARPPAGHRGETVGPAGPGERAGHRGGARAHRRRAAGPAGPAGPDPRARVRRWSGARRAPDRPRRTGHPAARRAPLARAAPGTPPPYGLTSAHRRDARPVPPGGRRGGIRDRPPLPRDLRLRPGRGRARAWAVAP